ncbi:MAG: hypothetical protein K5770_01285 [Lachnospiraceae bacterium]|nr:hypothetical protein [Lachnospiraceae bacterium]
MEEDFKDIEDVLMELVKDKVEEKVNNAEAAKEQETTISHIKNIMKNLNRVLLPVSCVIRQKNRPRVLPVS